MPAGDGLRQCPFVNHAPAAATDQARAAPHLRTLAKRREQADLSALASQYGAAFGGPIGAPAQPAKKAEYVERVYL